MSAFRSNRLTCVLLWCKNRIDRTVVQTLPFGHRLVWRVAAPFLPACRTKHSVHSGFFASPIPRDRVSLHKKSRFHYLE
jgi:hypothetical protein